MGLENMLFGAGFGFGAAAVVFSLPDFNYSIISSSNYGSLSTEALGAMGATFVAALTLKMVKDIREMREYTSSRKN